jgi:poly(A) polymerase
MCDISEEISVTHSQNYNIAHKCLSRLESHGFAARLAGGCVRDRLLGIEPKDFDIATDALPDEVLKIFRADGYKAIPTGIEHGTITVVNAGTPIEVTTLRQDVETNGRHAVVKFGKSFEADAERRDFTINAMYEDSSRRIFDFFGGQDDLKQKRLRFVGDAAQRVQEDFLRILRLFRFWSRFGFAPEPASLTACEKLAQGLSQISQERITSELLQMLAGQHRQIVMRQLIEGGVFAVICPDIVPHTQAAAHLSPSLDKIDPSNQALAALIVLMLNAELRNDPGTIARRLRLSNPQIKQVEFACVRLSDVPSIEAQMADVMEFIDSAEVSYGVDGFLQFLVPVWRMAIADRALLDRIESAVQIEVRHKTLRKSKSWLSSDEIMQALMLKPGPRLGKIQRELIRAERNLLIDSKESALRYIRESLMA